MLENERGFIARVGNDESIALILTPNKSVVKSVTSIVITAATNIVATIVNAAGDTVAKTYAFATLDTVGAVIDAINADGYFSVRLLDCLRAQASASAFNTTLNTTAFPGSYAVTLNTVEVDKVYLKVCPDRNPLFGGPFSGVRIDLQELKFLVDTAALGVVAYVYAVNGSTESLLWKSAAATVDTETTINFASGNGYISAPINHDLLIVLDSGDAITETATNYLSVVAKIGSIRK